MSRTRDLLRKLLSGTVLQKPAPLALRRMQPGHSLLVALEPRLVYDGAIAPTAVVAAEQAAPGDAPADGHSDNAPATHHDASDAASHDAALPAAQAGIEPAAAPRLEIVFIDRNIRDASALAQSFAGKAQIYWIDPAQNGVAQIGEVLSHYAQVDAVHIYSHADAAGELILGSTVVDVKTVDAYKQNLAAWGDHLAPGADIMLYGCDLAAGANGHALVDKIADYTHADVAASDDLTGAASAGGDWDLEVHHGIIETAVLADRDFDGVLTAPVLTGWDSTTLDTAAAQAGPVVIDSDVTLTSGLANYSGWQLEVSSPLSSEDVLFIRDEGSGAGQVGVQDAGGGYYLVNYGGNAIGYALNASGALVVYFTDGFGTTPTNAMVERVIENLTYQNTSGSPTTSRQIDLQLSPNGGGGSSPLTQIDTETNGQDGASGLGGQSGITVSPDGKFVYVTAADDDGIAYFTRDTTTSVLTFAGKITNGSGGLTDMTGPTGIDISSDGKSLYVDDRNSGKVYFFQRNTTTGALTYLASYSLPASSLTGDLAISPDQTRVLVSRIGSVSIYDRNTTTGALTYLGYTSWSASGGGNTPEMVVSPDGNSIYTAWGEGDFSFISRNPTTDALTRQAVTVPAGFKALNGLAISPDGKFVYLTDADSDAVAVYARNTTTGALTQTTVYYNGSGGVSNLDAPYEIRISPDGLYAFVTAANSGTITLFTRDTTTGALAYETALSAYNLNSASDMCLSPDGKAIYTTQDSFSSSTLNAFSFDASLIGGNDSTAASITLTLGVGNHAPIGADKTLTIDEDTSYTFSTADFGFSDADVGDSLSGVRIDSLPVNGSLTLSGVAVTAGQVIAAADIGNLVFTPAANANGTAYATFNFSVRDQSNAFDAAPNAVTVDVTPMPDVPVLTGWNPATQLADVVKSTDVVLDSSVSLSNGPADFAGWILQLASSGGGIDQLGIKNTGTGAGQIGVSGGNITYGGVLIGQVTGGTSGVPLQILLKSSATDASVAALIESLTYRNTGAGDIPPSRTLTLSLLDPLATGQMTQTAIVDGAIDVFDTYISPDGRYLYALAGSDAAVMIYARDTQTGALSFIGQVKDGVGGVDGLANAQFAVFSSDGTSLYISGRDDGDIAIFDRDVATGALTFSGLLDQHGLPVGIEISADDRFVYTVSAGSNTAIVIYARNLDTHLLTYVGSVTKIDGGINVTESVHPLDISPDGKFLYAGSYAQDTIAVFSIDATTGAMTYVGKVQDGVGGVDGIDGVHEMVMSPDGKYLYAGSRSDNGVAIFSRDAATGLLSFVTHVTSPTLGAIRGLDISADGRQLVTVDDGSGYITLFDRDIVTGAITAAQTLAPGDTGIPGVATGVTISADGRTVYISSSAGGIYVYTRDMQYSLSINAAFATPDRTDPVLSGWSPAPATAIAAQSGTVLLDTDVTLTSPLLNYNDWTLTLSSSASGIDILNVRDQGAGAGQIGLSGGNITYGGTVIGQLSGGNGAPLKVALNSNATDAAVEALIENLTLHQATGTLASDRTLTLMLQDPQASTQLDLAQMLLDGTGGVSGLNSAFNGTMSADGKFLYVANISHDDIVIFSRDAVTGALAYVDSITSGASQTLGRSNIDVPVISPDGHYLYVVDRDDNAVEIFSRNGTTGLLTYVDRVQDGVAGVSGLNSPYSIALTADGRFAYVSATAGNALISFTRDPATGLLTYQQTYSSVIEGGFDAVGNAHSVIISPDGKNLYLASYGQNTISSFALDAQTGALTCIGLLHDPAGVDGYYSSVFSPDGGYIYVSAPLAGEIHVFARDKITGILTLQGEYTSPQGTSFISLSPDGRQLYTGGGGLSVFDIMADGTPVLAASYSGGDYTALYGVSFVTSSPDGRGVYVVSLNNIVSYFSREAGDTIAQSATLTLTDALPAGADKTVTIDEDASYIFSIADFGFSDADIGDSLSGIRIDSLPVNGSLTLSGVAVTAGQVIAAADIGNLVFTPAANTNGTAYAVFNFSVRDQSNAFDAAHNAITVDVTPMPDVPVLTGWNPADQLSDAVKAGPVLLDTSVSLSSIYTDFSNWRLMLSSSDSGEDVLSVRNQGTGAGQIGVSGGTITYGGVAIGTMTGGAGAPLNITLNAAAGNAAVEALIENLTYQSTASGFPLASRTLTLSLEDPASPSALTYDGMVKDGVGGVDGLSYVDGTAISADGRYFYAAGSSDNAVSIFSRNPATGALSYLGMVKDGVGGVDGLAGASSLSLSPDGKTLYVGGTNDNAVAIFSRDAATGALSYAGMLKDGTAGVDGLATVRGVVVSPDGLSVYAAGASDNAIAIFSRDPSTGALIYQGIMQDGVGGVDGLAGARTIALSPDGKSVYVAGSSDNGLAVFTRDTTTGALTYTGVLKQGVGGVLGLSNPRGVTVSPDGNQVYVASYVDNAVAIFNRDTSTGALSYVGMVKDGVGGVDGLAGAQSVTISADGTMLYAAGGADSAIAVFRRDLATGALVFKGMIKNGVDGVSGLSWASAVTLSPDGRSIYVSGNNDSAVAIFTRDKGDSLLTSVTLNVTPVHDLPVITGWDPSGTVQENTVNAGYVVLDNSVTVTGDGNYNFTMILSTANFGGTQNIDQLAIRNQGAGAGQIGVSGSTITYGGVAIATYFNGGETDSNAQDLIIAFNGTASNAAVKALVENIEYANASDNPVATRTVTMRLEQGGLNLVGSADQAGQVVDYWSDGTYYYRAQTAGGIGAFSFDGTDLHVIRNLNTNPDYVTDIEGDGTYIYYTVGTKLAVARFDGTNWTSLASYDMGAAGQSLYCKNGYIFVADGANGVAAFTFDGTSLHLAASVDTPGTANRVWTDNTYYYVADGAQLLAYTFDGTSFTQRGSIAVPGGVATSVEGDGSFLYVGSPQQNNTLLAYSFDGTTFTQRASYSIPGSGAASDLQVSGGKIYLASGKEGLQVLSFDGTAFSLLSTQDRVSSGSSAQGVYVDASGNIFLANRNEPTSVFRYSAPTNIAVYQKVLTVNAENDAPTGADKTVTVNEDAAYTFSAADFGFADVDNGDSLSAVRIDSLPLAGTLKLSGVDVTLGQVITAANIGNLVFTPAADANGAAYADFNFSVRDQSGAYDAAPNKVTVDVTPVNDAPAGADKTVTIDEDTFYSFTPSDFGFSDVDTGDGLSAIRIDSLPAAGRLKLAGINVSAGQVIDAADIAGLVFTPAADANGTAYASFNFSVRDSSNAYDAAPNKITIDVTPVNDAPDGADKTVTVNEDAAYIFAAGDFGFSDVDTGDSLSAVRIDSLPLAGTLQLSGVDVTLGQVIAAANIGNLVFTPAADANGAAYADFNFSVRDQSNVYDDAPNKITIDVTPVNDAPTGADKTVTINEDASYTFSAADFGFSDIDTGDSLSAVRIDSLPLAGTLQLSGVDVTLGQVITAANIGNLVFAPAADANGSAYANFNFSVRDQSNAYDAAPNKITVDVTPVNDAPIGADKTVTVNEDAAYTFSAADFGFADVDSGDSLSAVRIDSLPLAGTLKLSGVDVTLGQVISAANIGNLVFAPAADANGAAYVNFNFSVRDQSNAYDAAPNKITVDVTPVNDAPTGADKTVTVNEDAAYTFSAADFGFSDIDTGDSLSAVRIDSLPLAGTLKLSGVDVTLGQVITAANIGNLIFTPVADASGAAYANFNFSVRDQSNAYDAAPNKITVDVTPVNDAPTGADKTVTVNEDAAYTFSATDFGFSDIDAGDSLSAVRIDSLPLAGTLKLSGVDVTLGQVITAANIGNLVFAPAADANGAAYANFNFSVRDQSNAYDAAPNKITVDVTPINDAPTGADKTVTVNEDAAYTFSAADFGFSDIDTGDSLSAVRIDSLPLAGTLQLSGVDVTLGQVITAANIGNLVFAPAADANGAAYANFNFSVRDQSGAYDAAPNKITVDVTPVNDAPSGADKTVTIDEDTFYAFTPIDFGFADIDGGDGLSAIRIDSLPAGGRLKLAGINVSLGQVIDAADIAGLVFTPAANANGAAYAGFNFSVRDQSGAFDAAPNRITVDVTPVNDAPNGHDATIGINQDSLRSFTAADFGFADVDAGDSLSAVQLSVPTAGTLALYGMAVTPGQVVAAADLAGLTFAPAAGVFGDAYAQISFKVRDGAGTFSAAANTLTVNVHKTGPTVAEDLTSRKPDEAIPPAAPAAQPPSAAAPAADFVPVIATMLDKIRDITAKQTLGRGLLPEEHAFYNATRHIAEKVEVQRVAPGESHAISLTDLKHDLSQSPGARLSEVSLLDGSRPPAWISISDKGDQLVVTPPRGLTGVVNLSLRVETRNGPVLLPLRLDIENGAVVDSARFAMSFQDQLARQSEYHLSAEVEREVRRLIGE